MSLYTKDHLLDGKIVYFQPKLGYRSGIEPIILASQASNKDKSILDLGSGCGPISLILAYRFSKAEIVGLENNKLHLELSQKSKMENKFNNVEFKYEDVCFLNKKYVNYFDLVLSNPPFFFENQIIKSKNDSINNAKYISKEKCEIWFKNLIIYTNDKGRALIINRFENVDFMLGIFRLFNVIVEITPILSFKDTKPKNVLISLKKNENYVEKTKNEIIIHSNSSKYSKQVEDWFK
ncbi:MAG: tRNA1(Val) (adenine(37)-N6)-methyltransferase [Alphaproteobacteria bacterium]